LRWNGFYKKQEFERAGFEKILNINLTGVMHLCTAFYPHLERSGGNIINLDSVVAIRPAINNPAYTASKAGLKQLTKGLAMKWGRKGIRVNEIAPGMVPTKLTANQAGAEQEAAFKRTCPIQRSGTPQDMAGGALFLVSPLAAYVTGQHLVIDGGVTL
jgi:3-oxoacyl-[acyl-carrier protein] reductase